MGKNFFKKKKSMKEKITDNLPNDTEQTDNMSQSESIDEQLEREEAMIDQREAEIESLVEKIEQESENDKVKAELEEVKDKYLRLVADFDNFRRRTAKERIELMQTAGKDVMQSLLVVLDDMDRASQQLEKTDDVQTIREGVTLVFNKLRTTLQQKGLRAMDAADQDFNPDLHDALTEIEMPDKKGKVINVVEPGYYLNDKLIRHAKVVVGK
jgi:molecular chaperone GrpE